MPLSSKTIREEIVEANQENHLVYLPEVDKETQIKELKAALNWSSVLISAGEKVLTGELKKQCQQQLKENDKLCKL